MDYERKYNNALERARQAIKDCGDNQGRKNMIYGIFPELQEGESEDENDKIITTLYFLIKDHDWINGAPKEQVLNWLAKLNLTPSNKDLNAAAKEYSSHIHFWPYREWVVPAFIHGAKWQEMQDQETIELAEDHAMLAGRMQMKEEMEKIMESDPDAIEKTPKQDYSGLTDFERAIHRGFLCAGVENVPVSIIKQTAEEALKRIPTEWSEEDEKKLKVVINSFYLYRKMVEDSDYEDDYKKATIKECIDNENWLKSLRPKPHWKPSEEQMDALDNAYKSFGGTDHDLLCSLYNDLKKL